MDKEYAIPDPKEKPVDCLVIAYKVTKGVPHDNRAWDKVHFARTKKAAKDLIEICGDLRRADSCLVDIAKFFNEKELSWTLETVVKHAHDWVAKKRGPLDGNANAYRARFFKALADRGRSEDPNKEVKKFEPLPDSLRVLADLTKRNKENIEPRGS